MYQIIKNGVVIATTQELNYIKRDGTLRNGALRFVACSEKEAEGIAVNGVAYSFLGREEIIGIEAVTAYKIDGGASIQKSEEQQTALAALLIDVKYKQTLLDLGVSENA